VAVGNEFAGVGHFSLMTNPQDATLGDAFTPNLPIGQAGEMVSSAIVAQTEAQPT
jgi:hypothetical protein